MVVFLFCMAVAILLLQEGSTWSVLASMYGFVMGNILTFRWNISVQTLTLKPVNLCRMGSHVPDVYLINQAERLRYDLWINLDMTSGRSPKIEFPCMGENCGTLKLASTNGVGPLFLKTGLPCFSGRRGSMPLPLYLPPTAWRGRGTTIVVEGGRWKWKMVSGK